MAEFRENRDVRRPFLSTPDARVYFPASVVEKARRDAVRCLKRGEGVALVIGDAGVGKTLLSRVLASNFDADDLVAVVSASRKFTVKAFLQQLLFGLHQTFVGGDETELRLMTLDYLERAPQKSRILLVDDAQNLSLRVFDEIRMLVDSTEPPAQLSVALFGTPALEDRLNLPQLYPFAQRVVTRAWLDSFSSEEVDRFINRELKRAGVNAKFTKAAKKAIVDLTEGSPRVVVQLCDRALFFATENAAEPEEGKKSRAVEIDENGVQAAWRDLQSIIEEESRVNPDSTDDVVEFGELDDDDSNGYDENASGEAPTHAEDTQTEVKTRVDEASHVVVEETPNAQDESASVSLNFVPANSTPTISTDSAAGDSEPVSNPENETLTEERKRAAKVFWDQKDEHEKHETRLEDDPETIEAAKADESADEIDESLEARLRAKLDAAEALARQKPVEAAPASKAEPMNFELVTENGNSYKTTSSGLDSIADATFVRPDGSRATHKQIPDLWEKGGRFDEALELDSAFPPVYESRKSVTRRPIASNDDGSDAFRSVNGFNADDAALFSAEDANLESQFSKLPEDSELADWTPDVAGSDAPSADLQRSLEDRAYRQIVASCYRSSSDFPSSDQYLHELRLLEQEIAEEANLIRRIRSIHLQLRAVREPKTDDVSKEDGSRNLPGSITSN